MRTMLIEVVDAWLARKPRRPVDLELDGTIRSLAEIERTTRAVVPDDAPPGTCALAMADTVVVQLLEDALRRQGAWQADAEAEEAFDRHRRRYDGTPFPLETMATQYCGFPSLDSYRRRFRVREAYGQSIEKTLGDDDLRAWLRQESAFANDRRTTVSVLRFAVAPGGSVRAHERAARALVAWTAGEAFATLAAAADPLSVRAVQPWGLTQMRNVFGENDYLELLLDGPPSRTVFRAPDGGLLGPLRGVDAWWVVRVDEQPELVPVLAVVDDRTRAAVRREMVQERYLRWAGAVLERTVFRLHER
jgi:hypothetical protein